MNGTSPRRILPLACALLVAGGCADFNLPERASDELRPIGLGCAANDDCQSGHCVAGTCCQTSCAETEVCAPTATERFCVERKLGEACGYDGNCPSGFCVDGVCCEARCAGHCLSCANPSSPGTCAPADDNTDARKQCGTCGACFGGVCAPALAGTDPNGACGGALCGKNRACAQLLGATCLTDADCSSGECIFGRCRALEVERLPLGGMLSAPTARDLVAAASDGKGAVAAVVQELTRNAKDEVIENDLFVLLRTPQGVWRTAALPVDPEQRAGARPAGVALLGRWAYVVTWNRSASYGGRCNAEGVPCGLYGQLFEPGGSASSVEIIDPDPGGRVLWAGVAVDPAGKMSVAYQATTPAGTTRLFLRTRAADQAEWSPRVVVSYNPRTTYDLDPWYGAPVLLATKRWAALGSRPGYGPDLEVDLSLAAGVLPSWGVLPGPREGTSCSLVGPYQAALGRHGDFDSLIVAVSCVGGGAFAEFRPEQPSSKRFETAFYTPPVAREGDKPQAVDLLPLGNASGDWEAFELGSTDLALLTRANGQWVRRAMYSTLGGRAIRGGLVARTVENQPALLLSVGPPLDAPEKQWELLYLRYRVE